MSDNGSVANVRRQLVDTLFDGNIPALWCPSLTHFAAPGELDVARIRSHLQHISPHVRGLLVPGSTGEGWEMTDGDIRDVLAAVLDAVAETSQYVLVGVLKTDIEAVLACIDSTLHWLRGRTGCGQNADAMARSRVVGFTVCPPKGSALSQSELMEALRRVLDLALPTALYQLPQVTENELSRATVATLAERYPNFYLWKDTSGQDRVAQAGLDLGGVFLVRGAEGAYAQWTKPAGGPYDGFLLSTANVFARQLHEILVCLSSGRSDEAMAIAERVSSAVKAAFELVDGFPAGNPFTNANKVLDHLMAFGSTAPDREPPLLYSGVRLPAEFIQAATNSLCEHQLMPDRGYFL